MEIAATCNQAPASLTVFTFNVGKEKEQLEARMAALAALIECHKPDLLMLQELGGNNKFTGPGHWSYLRELLRQSYALPHDTLFSEQGHGFKVALLSRLPLVLEDLRVVKSGHLSHRPAMVGTCTLPTDERLAIASCHLSPDFNVNERVGQICELQGALGGCGSALVAGDTNMSESNADARASVEAGFVDCWRPEWPSTSSAAAFAGDGRTRPRLTGDPKAGEYERIDRFFLRGALRCTHMEVVGTEPVASVHEGEAVPKWWNAEHRTISDHFALLGTFKATAEDG